MITFFTLGTYISSGMKNILTNYYFCQPMTEYLYSLDSRYLWFISDCVFHNQFCYPPSFQPQSSAPQLVRWILEAGESHSYSHTFEEFYYHHRGMMQFHAYTLKSIIFNSTLTVRTSSDYHRFLQVLSHFRGFEPQPRRLFFLKSDIKWAFSYVLIY